MSHLFFERSVFGCLRKTIERQKYYRKTVDTLVSQLVVFGRSVEVQVGVLLSIIVLPQGIIVNGRYSGASGGVSLLAVSISVLPRVVVSGSE